MPTASASAAPQVTTQELVSIPLDDTEPVFVDGFDDPSLGARFHELSNDQLEMSYDRGRFVFQSKVMPATPTPHVRAEHLPGRYADFACEVVGRVMGTASDAWMLAVTNQQNANRAVQVSLHGDGTLRIEPPFWEPEPHRGPNLGPIRHPSVLCGDQFNRLKVVLRGRWFSVFVNSVAVVESIELDRDVTPGVVAIGLTTRRGECRVELDQVTVWRLPEL
jgi:hypothetical protein